MNASTVPSTVDVESTIEASISPAMFTVDEFTSADISGASAR